MLQYVLTSDILSVFDGPNYVDIGRDHPNFAKVANLLSNGGSFEEVKELTCIVSAISSASDGKIKVGDGVVYYNGEIVNNAVVDAIFDYQSMGLPISPIVNFLENLLKNPSKNSIDQLWKFVEHHKLPLTEDGCLLAYKAVRSTYMDKYSNTIDNSIGKVITMNRSKISDDPNYHCAAGLHVGGLKYSGPEGWYSSNGDICVIVKVNPKDVVCVPHDHDATKVRVCEYEVVKDYCKILKSTVYDCNYDECECDEDCCDEYFEEFTPEIGSLVSGLDVDGVHVAGEVITEPDEDGFVIVREFATRRLREADPDGLSEY